MHESALKRKADSETAKQRRLRNDNLPPWLDLVVFYELAGVAGQRIEESFDESVLIDEVA